jgi:hypothetical protein
MLDGNLSIFSGGALEWALVELSKFGLAAVRGTLELCRGTP